jgi:hypothetical protein
MMLKFLPLLLLLAAQAVVAQVPVVTSDPATTITSISAAITGTVNPQGQPAGCFVEWGTTISYGTNGPTFPVPPANTAVVVSNNMIFLSPNTTYHYRLVATNSSGTGYSSDRTMTTAFPPSGQPPTAETDPATAITTTNAYLWALLSSGGLYTTYYFRWGVDTTCGNQSPSGFLAINESGLRAYQPIGGLSPGTTYHFQIVATNTAGTTFGADQVFTTQGFATNGADVYTYMITNGTITITGYSGPGGDLAIPNTIIGLPVTAIGDRAFGYVGSLTRVTIPNSVTILGMSSFADNTGLTNVTIPGSVTTISDSAFNNSGLTSVVIPDSVTNIGASAFSWCWNLTNLTIGNHVTFIGASAFSVCPNLTRVVIPDSVTWIDEGLLDWGGPVGVFGRCTSLTNVTVGSGLAYLGGGAFVFCPNLTGVYFRGNAPALDGSMFGQRIFDYSDSVIVYYLGGTTGWVSTYAGRPTMLWNAAVATHDGSVGMQQGRFGFNIAGTPDIPLVVEASSNPSQGPWVALESCTLTNGLLRFSDPDSTNTWPARFYRVRWP